jgi:hypothetical protein
LAFDLPVIEPLMVEVPKRRRPNGVKGPTKSPFPVDGSHPQRDRARNRPAADRIADVAAVSRREEWTLQSEFAALLTENLDPSCTWFTSLENRPLSRISGMLQGKRGVKSGVPDVQVSYRRKRSPGDCGVSFWRTVPMQTGAAAARAMGRTISGPHTALASASGGGCRAA